MKRARRENVIAANRYAREVVSGKIPACLFVRQACKRHLDDLAREKDGSFHFRFDAEEAEMSCFFIERQRHVKGIWAGKTIVLEPWQAFIVANLFGWKRKKTGLRRYRQAYVEVPRKNAKSTIAAVIGLKMFCADREAGAEVYSGATTEKQAWEVFRPARLMALKNQLFRKYFRVDVNAKGLVSDNGSRFEPIVGNPGDGSSPHMAIHDEFHEHATSEQSDAMGTGMGARSQPLQLWITTAGTNLAGPCYDKRKHVVNVLAGNAMDDELFGLIYTVDREDDWTDPLVWRKANPNFGVSVFEDFLEARRREAMAQASRQNIIRCKHLNQWLTANTSWMNMVAWRSCARDIRLEDFAGRECFLAADLASRVDIAALVFVFRDDDGNYKTFGRYYLPKATVMLPQNQHYQTWHLEGRLTVTPGASINLDQIESDILDAAKMFQIVKFGYDPFQATQMVGHLAEAGISCVEIGAIVKNFSDPMKAVEAAVLDERLHHNGCPIMEWMMGNVVAHYDAKDNIYPRKESEANKIDGPVALIMGMNMATRHEEESSVYEERGIREL